MNQIFLPYLKKISLPSYKKFAYRRGENLLTALDKIILPPPGNLLEGLITHIMSRIVIDLLEPIQIHQYAPKALLKICSVEEMLKHLIKPQPVGDTGEVVLMGARLYLFIE